MVIQHSGSKATSNTVLKPKKTYKFNMTTLQFDSNY